MPRIDVIHGPNLNLLGSREPEVYGSMTLAEIDAQLSELAKEFGVEIRCFQSNHEGELIDRIHLAGTESDFIIMNPGGYTHTSIAIRDAVASVRIPTVEIHLSNTQAREEFRHVSLIAGVATGRIEGFGPEGYFLALRYAAGRLKKADQP